MALLTVISPIVTRFSVKWFVYYVSHSCMVFKLFNRFVCHPKGTLLGFNNTLCQMGSMITKGSGNLGFNLQQKHAAASDFTRW